MWPKTASGGFQSEKTERWGATRSVLFQAQSEQELEDDFGSLTKVLLSVNRDFFLYRDFQSRNIMLRGGEP